MNEIKMTEYRIQRLKDAIDHISKGNKSDFGRKLDMRDGAFIRQMLAGTRPITEKTIRSIEAFHGTDDWFAPPSKQKQKVSAATTTWDALTKLSCQSGQSALRLSPHGRPPERLALATHAKYPDWVSALEVLRVVPRTSPCCTADRSLASN